jgi:acyl dehydratase
MRVIAGTEELRTVVGQELGTSDWFLVTQEMVDRFAKLTLDTQWIHMDVERAEAESPFGSTIAHGFLTLALLSHLFRQTVRLEGPCKMTVNYGFNRVRFASPVRTGSRVRLRAALHSLRDVEDGLECAWEIKIESEESAKPAVVAEWLTRIYF